jgi:hypothetical protein
VVGLRNVTNWKARAYKPDTAAARACVVVDAACQNFSRRRSFLESRRCLYIFLRKGKCLLLVKRIRDIEVQDVRNPEE